MLCQLHMTLLMVLENGSTSGRGLLKAAEYILSKIVVLGVLHAESSFEGCLVFRRANGENAVNIIHNKTSIRAAVLGHSLFDGGKVFPMTNNKSRVNDIRGRTYQKSVSASTGALEAHDAANNVGHRF